MGGGHVMGGFYEGAISGLMLILAGDALGAGAACRRLLADADATEVQPRGVSWSPAQKRSENLQAVPIAISTVSGNVLRA